MLTSQLSAVGRPMVLVLNMADEARAHGVTIDVAGLVARLGIPVVETVATEGRGVTDLRNAIAHAAVPSFDGAHRGDHAGAAHDLAVEFRRHRPRSAARLQERIGRWVREPLTGLPILALVLYVMYLAVGVFGAQTLVGLIEGGLFEAVHQPRRGGAGEPHRAVGGGP